MNCHVAPIHHIAEIQMIKFAAFSYFRVSDEIDINILAIYEIQSGICIKLDCSGIFYICKSMQHFTFFFLMYSKSYGR